MMTDLRRGKKCHQAYVNALFELSKLYEDARQYVDAIQAGTVSCVWMR
ncbi:MAG: hypothetical protein U0Z26_10230 [Anaerolineales bacterium]